MAIINFYRNNSDPNVVGKAKTLIFTKEGTFRDVVSVIDPVFTIELTGEEIFDTTNDLAKIMNINYCHIPLFKRFYFITDIVCLRTGIWQFSCHVDVLDTYKVELQLQRAIIARQENNYNLYLPDNRLITTAQRRHTTLDFQNKLTPATGELTDSLVVTLAGGDVETESS